MIRLVNVNKYFNRHKRNQIHVINNTTLTLEDKGLVSLLGSSGSGKTTLLNVIGGLDKVNSGQIFIDNQKITRKSINKIDAFRSLNIGYIFQDYNLIENMSVFDNVSIVLKMNGIKDKKEIKKRVEYCLDKVGMLRYKNRYANMLSGGERQRVGIARAIVKNPKLIIADEPTGNLDAKNTLEVMNIIKSISKDRLVILVTHEKDLAEFYSTRIIELKDGVITNDRINKHDKNLDYRIDNKIYLKDIKNKVTLNNKNVNINYYNENNEKLDIDIVIKNNLIYIENKGKEKIEVINEDSMLELVNDNYKQISKDIYEKYEFNFDNIINKDIKQKYKSIYNLFTLFKYGINKILDYSVIKKILLLGFTASSMFIIFAVSLIIASLKIEDKDFIKYNKEYLMLKDSNMSVEDYNNYLREDNINYIIPSDSTVSVFLPLNKYYQTEKMKITLNGSLSSIKMIKKNDLILGNMPENSNEIVIDKMILENEEAKASLKQAGYLSYKELLNKNVSLSNDIKEYKIVGITDNNSPSIYTLDSEFITILNNQASYYYADNGSNIRDYKLEQDKYELVSGVLPLNDYEVIISEDESYSYKLGSLLNEKVNGNNLKVVGYYKSKTDEYLDLYFVNENTIMYQLLNDNDVFSIYTKDKSLALDYFRNLGKNIQDSYDVSKKEYIESQKEMITTILVFSGIIIVVSLIEIYLIIRASFLSRIKEVGVLRAIGLKRIDIYKMFSGEILAITVFASIPGLLLMYYILYNLSKISLLSSLINVNVIVILISLVIVFVFNLLFGLIPVFRVIRKRPAEILSRNDI